MKTTKIIRLETGPIETFGSILVDGALLGNTLELPWRMNEQNISCVPAGQYIIERVDSPAHGDTFRVQDVHDRTGINFHPANYASQLQGCIAMGESIKKMRDSRRALINSGATFTKFMLMMTGVKRAKLTIVEAY